MIEAVFLIVFFTRGLYYSGGEGYIFEGLRRFIANLLGLHEEYDTVGGEYVYFDASTKGETWRDYLWKPIWGCIHCMNSFWGIVILLVFGSSLTGAVITLGAAVGFSFIIEKISK